MHSDGLIQLAHTNLFQSSTLNVPAIKVVKPCYLLKPIYVTISGHWFVDKNHFFAVANTKESRKDERYRCFLKNRDDDLFIGASITPECNTLKTVEKSPERYKITPVKVKEHQRHILTTFWHMSDFVKPFAAYKITNEVFLRFFRHHFNHLLMHT